MKTSAAAIIAALGLVVSSQAEAACNVSGGIISFTITGQLTETDCASTSTVNGQVSNLQTQIDNITTVDIVNGTIKSEDIGNGEVKNSNLGQNSVTSDKIQDHTVQGQDIAYGTVTGNNIKDGSVQKKDLSYSVQHQMNATSQWTYINTIWNAKQQGQIYDLRTENSEQWEAISANTALLSQHSSRLDSHAKGLAIAMAMPDTWLQPHEKFAIAGNIGGFDDETAIAFSGIARIDETWSLNAGLGSDTEFKEFGWKFGARAGW